MLNYLERLPADILFLNEEFYYSIFAGFSLSHHIHRLFFWCFASWVQFWSSKLFCSVSFSFLEVGVDVLEMDSAFGTRISPSLAFSRLWSVPSKGCSFSTETRRLLLRSQGTLEIWVKASKIFGFFHQKVVPDFADEGRQILLLL